MYYNCSTIAGNLCMITGGHNLGRVGTIVSRERHAGSFDIVHIKDSVGHTFATRYVVSVIYMITVIFLCNVLESATKDIVWIVEVGAIRSKLSQKPKDSLLVSPIYYSYQ